MRDSPPIVHRATRKRARNLQEGEVLSFTTIAHAPVRFGKRPRTVALIQLEDGSNVLAELLTKHPAIGMRVRPRMQLSHVTTEKLRVYDLAFEPLVEIPVPAEHPFPGYILALTGPSGVGKSTISRLLVKVFSDVTAPVPILTTRPPKPGDEHEYHFVAPQEFERLQRRGEIVAATHIPSSMEDRRYGYRASDLEAIWQSGKLPVVITEMHLLEGLARHYGRRAILSFGLLPPGRSKRLKLSQLLHRLRQRGRDSEAHIRERLRNAEADLAFFEERKDLFDSVLVNDDLDEVVETLKERISGLAGA